MSKSNGNFGLKYFSQISLNVIQNNTTHLKEVDAVENENCCQWMI